MKENEYDFSLYEVLKFIARWKWHVLALTLLAGIAAAVFTGPRFITPKYESKVVFYPTTNNSISNAILSDNSLRDKDALEFGEEAEAEYALQILGSASLMAKVISRFDLMGHYGIDPSGNFPYTRLAEKIRSNISFKRTELLSIEIRVLDKDPQMAADIANYISASLDTTKTEIHRQVARKSFEIIRQEYEAKIKEVEEIQQTINQLSSGSSGEPGLISNPFSRKNKKAARQDALQNSDKLTSGGGSLGTLLTLTESLSLQVEQMNDLKKKYERAKVDLEEYIPHHFVISPAEPAEKKSYPVRWIMVLVTVASVFALSVVSILIIEKLKSAARQLKERKEA
jgi:capsular polysaccharide biosynthesis protein